MADGHHTRIGDAAPRHEGRVKVTGEARYPSDMPLHNPAYAWLVTSAIARGRIKSFRLDAARAVPGFIDILTFQNTQGQVKTLPAFGGGSSTLTLESDQVQHDGQIIGVVLADSLEAAREAAYKVGVDYEAQTPTAGFDSPGGTLKAVTDFNPKYHLPTKGDAAAAFAAAPVKIAADYETPTQHHNAMELFTVSCEWTDGKLTVHEPSQYIHSRAGLAAFFGMDQNDIRVVSRYVGGGFGGKSSGTQRTALIALAAKRLKRPVKLVATRDQGYTINTYRAETRHHVKIAAGRDGKIQAFIHEGTEVTSRPSNYMVGGVQTTGIFYDYGAVATKVSILQADRNTPGFMRSPAQVPYMFALESAMDELAYALNMDPVQLRRINDAQVNPINGKPYSSRHLNTCFEQAAKAFGWAARNPEPRSMRDGDWLIGWGCASTCYPSHVGASGMRITLTSDGTAKVQVAFIDIGQGSYTLVAQTAADRLGLPISKVAVEMGDSNLPPGSIAGGSNGAATSAMAVANTCEILRDRLAQAAVKANAGPLAGADPAALTLTAAGLTGPRGSESLKTAVGRLGGIIEATGEYAPPGSPPGAIQRLAMGIPSFAGGHNAKDYVSYAFGAQFVEVRVHARTGEIRAPRLVGAFAAGTIVSKTMAHSQLMGGLIWGLSSALHEATEIDHRAARYTNDNFADYLIPVNADVRDVQVIFVPEQETMLNPMGIKGIGELGNVGVNAAVANAVFHATGKRIRRLPIRIEDLI